VEDAVALFTERVSDYRARVVHTQEAGVGAEIALSLHRHGSRRAVVPLGFPDEWLPKDSSATFQPDRPNLSPPELDGFDATVTACALAVAQTGTIVLDAGPGQGRRALSLVPDHLIVVVRAQQIVGDVPDAVARLGHAHLQTWISGPSATSDIELDRVEGVHGPRKLDVIVVAPVPG